MYMVDDYDEHDPNECGECTVMEQEVDHHRMTLIMPCFDDAMIWFCDTCEIIERWGLNENRQATAEIANAAIHLHVLRELTMSSKKPTSKKTE